MDMCYSETCGEYSVRPMLVPARCDDGPLKCYPYLPHCAKAVYCCEKTPKPLCEESHYRWENVHRHYSTDECHSSPPHKPHTSHTPHTPHTSHTSHTPHTHHTPHTPHTSHTSHTPHTSHTSHTPHTPHKPHKPHETSCNARPPSPHCERHASCTEQRPVKTKYIMPCYRYEDGRIANQPTVLMRRACEVAVGNRPRRKAVEETCRHGDIESRHVREDEEGCYHPENEHTPCAPPKKPVCRHSHRKKYSMESPPTVTGCQEPSLPPLQNCCYACVPCYNPC